MARRTRRQAFGQHFLNDESIAEQIIAAAQIGSTDRVFEIGPGPGILTERLMDIAPLTVIEKDDILAATLRARYFEDERLELIEGDALKLDWPDFDVLVSNLPYSVATPILLKLLEEAQGWQRAVVMVQAEVAKRLVSQEGRGYGRLSIAVDYRAKAKRLFKVSREAFSPPPRVHSAVVFLEPLAKPPYVVTDEAFFFDFVGKVFQHRRKTLRNCLKLAWPKLELDGLEDLDLRPEALAPAKLAELSDEVRGRLK